MFNITTRYFYKKTTTPENNNAGVPACSLSFFSDSIEFQPFIKNYDVSQENEISPNTLINFSKGLFSSIEVQRSNWTDLETRVNAIIDRLKTELNSGLTFINYSDKPVDKNENSQDGATWV